jgi:hypothetical protein
MTALRKLFCVGPVVMLVLTFLWATAWHLILRGENQSWYIIAPLMGFLVIGLAWHIALLIFEKNRLLYSVYALVDVPVLLVAYEAAVIFATRFPL